ncbi:MAG: mandelate racemase/muconate lactonizing protein [Verrucomicrobiota bacterium]|nr:mandelate racemase/muconate lactonizing protein [Verrucomicrobiota bacterium]
MKIIRIETIPIRVPLKKELAIRSGRGGAHVVSPFLLVKIFTDEGIIGLGEVSCTPRWSGEDQMTAAHFIQNYLAPLLIGQNPIEVEKLSDAFRLAVAGNCFTKAGIEMALWDIAGKAVGKPVYELLGGAVREFVPTKWSVSGVEPEKAAAIAKWAGEEGFKTMKVKVGIEPNADVARVQAVRAAIGDKIKLGVDANGGWAKETAVKTIERLYSSKIYFVEQPLAPEEILSMPDLRRQIRIPIVADESIYSLQDAMTMAYLKAADVFSIYVGKAGGIGSARKIAMFAESAGFKCTVGSNLELGIGSAAMIHLAMATHGIAAEEFPCDIIGPFFYEDDLLKKLLLLKAGEARPNSKPGLGIELDDEKVERYRVKQI